MRHTLLLAASCLGLLACGRPATPPLVLDAPVPTSGKLTAPVTVTATFSPGRARVDLRFEAGATEVSAGVRGLDGLELGPTPTLGAATYAAGQVASLDLPLGTATGTLAVYLRGTFRGLPMSRTVTFALGERPRLGAQDEGVVQTDLGALKALPAATER